MICTEDYECAIDHFCWYATKEDAKDKIKRCMKLYSTENKEKFGWAHVDPNNKYSLEDYTQNGMFCKTGLAY